MKQGVAKGAVSAEDRKGWESVDVTGGGIFEGCRNAFQPPLLHSVFLMWLPLHW